MSAVVVSEEKFFEFVENFTQFQGEASKQGENQCEEIDCTPWDVEGTITDYWIDPADNTCGYTLAGGMSVDVHYSWKLSD